LGRTGGRPADFAVGVAEGVFDAAGAAACPDAGPFTDASAGAAAALAAGLVMAAGCATTGGGRTLTEAFCSTCGESFIAAGAALAAVIMTVAGTTVAAERLAKVWFTTSGGGETVRSVAAT
jgi:hypothetical protein